MKLRINSKVSYDVDVNITTETENIELELKAEETCQIDIQEKHVVLVFKESKSNIIATIIEKILIVILNYIYFCISYDDFSEASLFIRKSPCIKINLDVLEESCSSVDMQYATDESLNKGGIDIGKIVSEQPAVVNYILDENEFIKAEKQGIRETCLYMIPAMVIIIIGICSSVFTHHYLIGIALGIIFIGLLMLTYKFVRERKERIESHLAYLKYQLKKISTGGM